MHNWRHVVARNTDGARPRAHFLVETYLPHPIEDSGLVRRLQQEWSAKSGGTTSLGGTGTFMGETEEDVTVLRVYVPESHGRAAVVAYFQDRKRELEQTFKNQDAFLMVMSAGHVML